jgi:hypothetical protein
MVQKSGVCTGSSSGATSPQLRHARQLLAWSRQLTSGQAELHKRCAIRQHLQAQTHDSKEDSV